MEIKNEIDLMIIVMKLLSESFPSQAILRGGMALYLLNSKRYTNDLDYAFIPYNSKNDVVEPVINALKKIDSLDISYELNSKCFRIKLNYQGIRSQLEIKTYKELASVSISTSNLKDINIPAFIVRIADLDWSLSNKIAAWWERRLARDLYDIYFLASLLGATPDLIILDKRLKKLCFTKNVKEVKTNLSLKEFSKDLRERANQLDYERIKKELKDYFASSELVGIDMKIRLALMKICEMIEQNLEER